MKFNLRRRIGDFWWYSIILFCSLRFTDLINAFTGLWIVPKFVSTEELGAVLPLTNFASALGLPISVLVVVFSKHLNTLAVRGEHGKIKKMLRDVFIAAAVLMVFIVIAAHLLMPLFFNRLRVEKGSLGILIIASAMICTIHPVYTNAVQALKKFTSMSVMCLLAAPLRLVVMVVAMPFRALSGYFVGQATPPLLMMAGSVVALHKELGPEIKTKPYFDIETRRWFARYTTRVALYMIPSMVCGLVEMLVIRQRLPAEDSAAFYIISRFAEIGTYLGQSLTTILVPLAAEASERGDNSEKLLHQSMTGTLASGCVIALGFAVAGSHALSLLPNGNIYAGYTPQLVALTVILAAVMTQTNFISFEMAGTRFGFLRYIIPASIFEVVTILSLTGWGYFSGILPDTWVAKMAAVNASRLNFILGVMGATALLKLLCIAIHLRIRYCRRRLETKNN